ncbi:MAG: site-specific DNA-methyltransferase [Betaproteobacteria bacterium]
MATKKPRGSAKSDAERTGKRIDAIHHGKDKRLLIPSREEAGQEAESPVVQSKRSAAFPLNPVTTRGQDPELFWMHKYGPADDETRLSVDIRSLYRHEHIEPETMIHRLYKISKSDSPQNDFFVNETFGNLLGGVDELDKPKHYYKQVHDWRNRLIQGDSLLVMTSLLEREGMAGKVQMIYIDPPYGVRYGSNWQIRLDDKRMPEADPDDALSGEPEVIKAFRDTWELGVHSYLTYLRERLLVARDLLTPSGSCFVQISDENVHLVRSLMDEVFGSNAFFASLLVKKKGSQKGQFIEAVNDYVLWYGRAAKDDRVTKFRSIFEKIILDSETLGEYRFAELPDGTTFNVTDAVAPSGEQFDYRLSPRRLHVDYPDARLFRANPLTSGGERKNQSLPFEFQGKVYEPGKGNCWKTTVRTDDGSIPGMQRLAEANRLLPLQKSLRVKSYLDDFGYQKLSNWWDGLGGAGNPVYVVQTNTEIVRRCMLMTTDPGDLVLDPTCGSGTTAFVAEQWGRRWITVDTSRIAINTAKGRLATAAYPWYVLHDSTSGDVRQGFRYKKVPHVKVEQLANNEPPDEETLYDNPEIDRKRLRVSGPFTVETLQGFEPTSPGSVQSGEAEAEGLQRFTDRAFAHLQSAGIKNGIRNENAVFTKINPLAHEALHAEGWYTTDRGEAKAYLYIGPQFGMVSRQAVNEAIKECRLRGDADWLVIMGFAFESDIENREVSAKLGGFMVTKVRMHDDLMQEGLVKKDKKAASFVTIGEPDIQPEKQKDGSTVIEIRGLDIYDPIRDEVKPRSAADIAYWMVDDDYDGSSFIVRQVFFCGGDKDDFDKWKKGLSDLAKQMTKKKVEQTLKVEIDDEAFDRLYGFRSHPIPPKKGRRIAVRVVSQFGEESTKVIAT